jgi:hypothetical protein
MMHPGVLAYTVETMLRLRQGAEPAISYNFDPSYLFWNGGTPWLPPASWVTASISCTARMSTWISFALPSAAQSQ